MDTPMLFDPSRELYRSNIDWPVKRAAVSILRAAVIASLAFVFIYATVKFGAPPVADDIGSLFLRP